MNTVKLRQCPFCGHAKAKMEYMPVTPIFEDDKTRNWFVECQKCGAQGPCSNREDKARDYWQERNYEKPVLERPFLRPHDDFGSKMDGAW